MDKDGKSPITPGPEPDTTTAADPDDPGEPEDEHDAPH